VDLSTVAVVARDEFANRARAAGQVLKDGLKQLWAYPCEGAARHGRIAPLKKLAAHLRARLAGLLVGRYTPACWRASTTRSK
jgi:hypothetical protein